MRLYLKLLLLVALFLAASRSPLQQAVADGAYDARVIFVNAFGTQADRDRLMDDTQRALARKSGRMDVYEKGKRFRELLERRVREAATRGKPLDDAAFAGLLEQCQAEVFGDPEAPAK